MIDGFAHEGAQEPPYATPAWIPPYADWYIARDHRGVDPDALESAFAAGFAGLKRVPVAALDLVEVEERGEVRAAFEAGKVAAKGVQRT